MSKLRPAMNPGPTRRRLCALAAGMAATSSLGGCAGMFSKKPPPAAAVPPAPPPKPGTLSIDLAASATLNPNANGRPSPLVVRLYELKARAQFETADFLSLYDKDQSVLGGDIVAREEYVFRPGESKTIRKALAGETRFIGVVAAFRELERARWRDVVAVLPNKDNQVQVSLDGITVRTTVSAT